ncbi:LytTR family DNA-binding domain-containing protein [Congregibacter variabilis]|uniref:LytTR family DNA-binding domain-containing protein n=1 Tax=Congregibacter variabilis TaxID=3081200 RepID=A0ABZ0I5Q7_9GAMM|nr:LytTR family DNA-binding domain-containing protein [Congregibacter sp. IMCC43200]
MRVLVVDDEPLARDLLLELLSDSPDLEVVGSASSGREALAAIRSHRPDLVLLDIEMPGMNGFEVVESLQADDCMPLVIFATAFNQYAVDAFDKNAVDYILKPVDGARLQKALLRARGRLLDGSKAKLLQAITAVGQQPGREALSVEEALESYSDAVGRLPVRQGDSVQLLELDDIEWVDAAGDYMCVHSGGETFILRCTMKQLSDRLSLGPFARIHRSTLVNLNKILEITPLTKGECMLHLGDDTRLKVSRNYRSTIQHLLV